MWRRYAREAYTGVLPRTSKYKTPANPKKPLEILLVASPLTAFSPLLQIVFPSLLKLRKLLVLFSIYTFSSFFGSHI